MGLTAAAAEAGADGVDAAVVPAEVAGWLPGAGRVSARSSVLHPHAVTQDERE